MARQDRFFDDPLDGRRSRPRLARRIAGGMMVAFAAGLVLIATGIILWPNENERRPPPSPTSLPAFQPLGIASVEYPTPYPTPLPPLPQPTLDWIRPTAGADEITAALAKPVINSPAADVIQRKLDPLTIIPARPRSTAITYTVQKGDNLRDIAARFGLQESTIIWSNDRFYVNAMRVGMELTILPVDGIYHAVIEPQTIAHIAEEYQVDPYTIIDSEYNTLFNARPQSMLPAGYVVIVPGGTGSTEPIYWDPGVVVSTNAQNSSNPVGTGVNAGTDYASFAVGDPGSCGQQPVSGGSPPYGPPLYARYTITQDFSWTHGGIDLAVPPGTPVYAAGGGTVIFSGKSTWGYGYTVVIAHGGTLSLYGHLNGAFVDCGQVVEAGQNIAVTGNSGRSSGPHLHFEIRGPGGAPVNPWDYQSF